MDPNGNGIKEYAWKPGTPQKTIDAFKKAMDDLHCRMEQCTRFIDNGTIEAHVISDVVKIIDLPTPKLKTRVSSPPTVPPKTYQNPPTPTNNQYATALSVGMTYWSPTHTDADFYFTAVIFIGPSHQAQERWNDVLQYFCFPEYNLKVPMRSGEVLIFNPSVAHACSNPRFQDSFACSNFCALKTVREQASQHFNVGKNKIIRIIHLSPKPL